MVWQEVVDWIAGVQSVKDAKAVKTPTYRLKNEAELKEHVIVAKDGDRYIVYTHDFTESAIPTLEEKTAGFVYRDKLKAIASARHLLRTLHSTQEHPALVM